MSLSRALFGVRESENDSKKESTRERDTDVYFGVTQLNKVITAFDLSVVVNIQQASHIDTDTNAERDTDVYLGVTQLNKVVTAFDLSVIVHIEQVTHIDTGTDTDRERDTQIP